MGMIPTGHLLVGGAVGAAIAVECSSPLAVPAALAAGIVSHHLLDLLPHTDAATFWPDPRELPWHVAALVALEVLVGLCLTGLVYVAHHTTLAFIAGALGGMLPDLLDEVPLWARHWRQTWVGASWHRWHCRLHCPDMSGTWVAGLVIDAAVISGGLWYLLR
jgi:hypothetical protein